MGTDRFTIHAGPCTCGRGKYIVDECSPDHAYARPSQTWWDSKISCRECASRYELRQSGNGIVRLLRSEVLEQGDLTDRWHLKLREIDEYADSKGYFEILAARVNSFDSMAELHRELTTLLVARNHVSTFRRHFKARRSDIEWVKRQFHGAALIRGLAWAGIDDNRIKELTTEADMLWRESQKGPKSLETVCKIRP